MRFWLWVAMALATCAARSYAEDVDPLVLAAERDRVAAVAKACRSAVAIFADGGNNGGSGVLISADGYALSNFHVTSAAGRAMKCGLNDGRLYDAVIVGIDPVGDVALIKLVGRSDFPAAELADSDEVRVGDWAFAVGNPFLLATDFQPTVSYGIVSGVHRYQDPAGTLLEYADCLQTDAAINPGNSGGPLFNARGQVIGINGRGSFEKRGRVNVGVGYAISINQIKNFLGHLRGGRIVDHATLDALVSSDQQGRVLVSDVISDSDAARRGLRIGDEIVSFGGRRIRTVNGFKNVLGTFPKGWQVPLTYRRGTEMHDILVRLNGVHGVQELIDRVSQPMGDESPRPEPQDDPPQPEDKRPKKPAKPAPPVTKKKAEQPLPDAVKPLFESRRGYANYYFNKLERGRVWERLRTQGDFAMRSGTWVLSGQLLAPGDCEFRLNDTSVEYTSPGGRVKLDAAGDLSRAIEPIGSGGMLAALHLWRRLLVHGPEKFGDVYYLGAVPLAGQAGLVDVLVGTHAGIEGQFYVDRSTGRLLKLETRLPGEPDPCELWFSQMVEKEGYWLPMQFEVRLGDQVYGAFKLANFRFLSGAE